jgi:hypothetical protein
LSLLLHGSRDGRKLVGPGILRCVSERLRLSLALAVVLTATGSAQPQRFALAIVRLDGRLVPFAAYESGRWQRAWPEADEAVDVDGKPMPEMPTIWRRHGRSIPATWHAWPAAGGRPIEVHTHGLEIVEAHCQTQVALATDLPEMKAEHPLKFGVAVDANLPLRSIQSVSRSDAAWSTAERAVRANFSKLEAAQVKESLESWRRESPPPRIKIRELYRESSVADSLMYFVAEKQYRRARNPHDPSCGAATIIAGWLVLTQTGTWAIWDPRVFLTDCDEKEASTAWPMASLQVSGRLFWVLQQHGWEDEHYIVVEIGQSAIQSEIDFRAGGC